MLQRKKSMSRAERPLGKGAQSAYKCREHAGAGGFRRAWLSNLICFETDLSSHLTAAINCAAVLGAAAGPTLRG